MDKIQRISEDRIKEVTAVQGFNTTLITKDYYVTVILYLLRDMDGIYFKGGTALQKVFLNYSRLSEDVDFTVTGDIYKIKREITKAVETCGLFKKISQDKEVDDFLRLVVHYDNFSGEEDTVFIDLNKRAKLLKKPEKHKISHFYKEEMPDFLMPTLAKEEMIAEKMAATIARNKPRDHFDIYQIIKAGMNINIGLVKKKCEQAGTDFNIIRIFNKAKKLKNRWDADMLPLLAKEISFHKVMATLSDYFKLKEAKELRKIKNS